MRTVRFLGHFFLVLFSSNSLAFVVANKTHFFGFLVCHPKMATDKKTVNYSHRHDLEEKWLAIALQMPFISTKVLEPLLIKSDDQETCQQLLKDFKLSWGSASVVNSLLSKCGDSSGEKTHRRILDELKHKLLGIAGRHDKSVSLIPCPPHGRPPSKQEAAAILTTTSCGQDDSNTEMTQEDDGISGTEVVKIDGGGVKKRVFTCEEKWLILSVTFLNCVRSTERVDADGMQSLRVSEGGYFKIRALILELLLFDVSERSIQNIHAEFNGEILGVLAREEEKEVDDRQVTLAPKLKGHSGRPSRLDNALRLRITEANDTTEGFLPVRELCEKLEELHGDIVSKSAMHDYLQDMLSRTRQIHPRPKLTLWGRMTRLLFVLQQIDISDPDHLGFKSFSRQVYLDEKWFWLGNRTQAQRILEWSKPIKEFAHSEALSRDHMEKIMFLCGVGLPRPEGHPDGAFDGKIACVALGEHIEAQRSSINRPAGTVEYKPASVTADLLFNVFTTSGGVIEAIAEAFPNVMCSVGGGRRPKKVGRSSGGGGSGAGAGAGGGGGAAGVGVSDCVTVIWDNAPAHTGKKLPQRLRAYCDEKGYNIDFHFQPAHSPELNILDLTVFSALSKQAAKLKRSFEPKTLDEFQAFIIKDVWSQYDSEFLTNGYGYLCRVYNNVLKTRGDNIALEGHQQTGLSVKAKRAAGVPLETCNLSLDEYHGLVGEVIDFFTKYKPPSRGYRPTLPFGLQFGRTPLPREKNGAESDDDDDDDDG